MPLKDVFEDEKRHLILTGLTEGLTTYFKLSLHAGFMLSFPVISYQLYLFLAPGLYKQERLMFVSYIVSSIILFIIGMTVVYFLIIPTAWKFFIGFESIERNTSLPIILEARVSEYLDLVLDLVLGFGLAFQLPIFLVTLLNIGVIQLEHLVRFRRYAVVIIFIIAAVLTPPDVHCSVAV